MHTLTTGMPLVEIAGKLMQNADDQSLATAKFLWGPAIQASGADEMTVTASIMAGRACADSDLIRRVLARPRKSIPSAETAEKDRADYILRDLIGRGGMGEVFSATDVNLERIVAVKMLRAELLDDANAVEQFVAEGLIAADLDHPNTVPIYEIGVTDQGKPFYSMRLVGGARWSDILAANALERNLSILLRVSDAVAFAHDRGIIHRDLKPDNVLIGNFGEVVLVDWGLAASVGNPRAHRVSSATAFAGTPAYMSPEVAACDIDNIGKLSDVYCLGGILYEIVTGLRPHVGSQIFECLGAALRNYIQPTDKRGELVEISFRALSTNPEHRYASVSEFQSAIQEFLSHLDSLALTHQSRQRFEALPGLGPDELYRECSEIIALYQQSLHIWPKNLLAAEGLIQARDTFAGVALRRGEIQMARSQVKAIEQERKKFNLASLTPDSVADRIKALVAVPELRTKGNVDGA